MKSHRRIILAAAAGALAGLALAPAAPAATGTDAQLVSGTVVSVITVTPSPVVLTGMSPGSSSPAAGSGTVT